MTLPAPFRRFTSFFHQDIDIAYTSPEALVDEALRDFTPQERQALKDYMKELTDGKYDEMQLREIWLKSRAEVVPLWDEEGNCTEFLKYLRELVEKDVPPET
jgi:hypothetical protein